MRVPRFPVSAADGALRYPLQDVAARLARPRDARVAGARAGAREARSSGSRTFGPALRRIGREPFAAKARQRLWSTRYALGIVCDLGEERTRVGSGVELEVTVEPAHAFTEAAVLLEQSSGFEYLFLRGLERTRLAEAGELVVARTLRTAGPQPSTSCTTSGNRVRLERVARGLYPQLGPDEALTEAVYCVPELRGRHVASAMLDGDARPDRAGRDRACLRLHRRRKPRVAPRVPPRRLPADRRDADRPLPARPAEQHVRAGASGRRRDVDEGDRMSPPARRPSTSRRVGSTR
jgi:hypothetical protein